MHMARHYLTYHRPLGDPVEAVNVPGEWPGAELAEESATAD